MKCIPIVTLSLMVFFGESKAMEGPNLSESEKEKLSIELRTSIFRLGIDYNKLQHLIDKGAFIDHTSEGLKETILHEVVRRYGLNGFPALKQAFKVHRVRLAEFLLINKADVNSKNVDGRTILMTAVKVEKGRNKPLIELLLNWGADSTVAQGNNTAATIAKRYAEKSNKVDSEENQVLMLIENSAHNKKS